MSIPITDYDDFDEKLEQAGGKLVIVDFFATWCGPCKMIAPKIEEIANSNSNVVILKVDVEEREDLALRYNISSSMPTFLFIKNKDVVYQFSGANVEKLTAVISNLT